MKTSDGREMFGVTKETELAEEEYRQAVEQSKAAGLLQWGADDGAFRPPSIQLIIADICNVRIVFTISVGSISARAVAITKIEVRPAHLTKIF